MLWFIRPCDACPAHEEKPPLATTAMNPNGQESQAPSMPADMADVSQPMLEEGQIMQVGITKVSTSTEVLEILFMNLSIICVFGIETLCDIW